MPYTLWLIISLTEKTLMDISNMNSDLTDGKALKCQFFRWAFTYMIRSSPFLHQIKQTKLFISLKDVFLTFIALLQCLLNFKLLQTGKHQTWTCPDWSVPRGRFSMCIKMSCLMGFLLLLYILLPTNVIHWRSCISLPVSGIKIMYCKGTNNKLLWAPLETL